MKDSQLYSFNNDIGLDTYVKTTKIRKDTKCELVGMMPYNILTIYPPCGETISAKSTMFDVWEYQSWGNSIRPTTQIRYCGECAIKYNMEVVPGRKGKIIVVDWKGEEIK